MLSRPWAIGNPSTRNLLAVGGNLSKGVIGVLGILALLGALGYPVTTLLAGLGIGGLAFAFGAQKTVENLFGSMAIAIDQPFRVGDLVRVGDLPARWRTSASARRDSGRLTARVISIPNGSLADQRLESLAERDRIRLAATVGLVYGTTRAQMQQVLDGFATVLRSHPRAWPDSVTVAFIQLGPNSLDIEVAAGFLVLPEEFNRCRQEVLLEFMRVVEEAGTTFALPTRTVHLSGTPSTIPENGGDHPRGRVPGASAFCLLPSAFAFAFCLLPAPFTDTSRRGGRRCRPGPARSSVAAVRAWWGTARLARPTRVTQS